MIHHNIYCTQQKNYIMHYFKSALAGFGMSFIGTSLCGSKVSEVIPYKKSQDYNRNYWYNSDFNKWSAGKAFLINNIWFIPTSLLGALFHDKVGRDLTPKINDYFDSDISPYLVTGGLFGGCSTFLMLSIPAVIYCIRDKTEALTQPWIYSLSIIQGFLIGTTAMAGAYFGDETTDEIINSEFTNHDNDISV